MRCIVLLMLLSHPFVSACAQMEATGISIPLEGWLLVDNASDSENPLLTHSTQEFIASARKVELGNQTNQGYTRSAYWILIPLPHRDLQQQWWLEYDYPLIDYIDVYFGSDASGWQLAGSSGDQRSWFSREVYSPVFYFSLPKQSAFALVRLQTMGSMQYPLRMVSDGELKRLQLDRGYLHGLFFGALSIMIFYNLFVFVMSRELAYLYYVLLISCITVFELAVSGYGYMYLWRNDMGWVNAHVQATTVGACLTFVMLFTRRVLQTQRLRKNLDKLVLAAGLISALLAIVGSFVSDLWVVRFTALWPIVVVMLIVYASFNAVFKRHQGARLFLLAWSGGLVGALLFSGQMQGWLPSNLITVNGLKLGIVLNVTLLSFSLVSLIQKLKQEKEHLQRKADENYQLALSDGLTGVPNRRAFDERLVEELERGKRDKTPISMLMIDIDFFKNFNDAYGHQAGDDTLIRTALVMRACLRRPADVLFRYGGEEFSVILPDTDESGARNTAQRIMKEIRKLCIPHKESPFKQLTVSIGLAVSKNANIKAADFIRIADEALYQSKRSGRNTVSVTHALESSVVNIGDYFKNTPKDTL